MRMGFNSMVIPGLLQFCTVPVTDLEKIALIAPQRRCLILLTVFPACIIQMKGSPLKLVSAHYPP